MKKKKNLLFIHWRDSFSLDNIWHLNIFYFYNRNKSYEKIESNANIFMHLWALWESEMLFNEHIYWLWVNANNFYYFFKLHYVYWDTKCSIYICTHFRCYVLIPVQIMGFQRFQKDKKSFFKRWEMHIDANERQLYWIF